MAITAANDHFLSYSAAHPSPPRPRRPASPEWLHFTRIIDAEDTRDTPEIHTCSPLPCHASMLRTLLSGWAAVVLTIGSWSLRLSSVLAGNRCVSQQRMHDTGPPPRALSRCKPRRYGFWAPLWCVPQSQPVGTVHPYPRCTIRVQLFKKTRDISRSGHDFGLDHTNRQF
jgi:hypothetical protein